MAELHQISFPIEKELSQCVELYDKVLSHEDDLLGTILEHVRSRKGKMMRPILVLLTAKEFAPVNEVTYNVALALELFHNASLLHDDVVDESDERRGLKSVNAKFGNGWRLSVVAGFATVGENRKNAHCEPYFGAWNSFVRGRGEAAG